MLNRLYSYSDIRILHLEPTAKCQAACPMCGRNLAGGRTRGNIPLDEISLEQFCDWFPPSFLQQLSQFVLCGNFGDPIMAAECLPIVEHAKATNPDLLISLNTNGSARPAEFWQALGKLGISIHFAIDGATEDSHARYRRNTRFASILENARTFIAAGGRAVWDMLVFRHNEHEVDAAREIARKAGFNRFYVKSTNRFFGGEHPVEDQDGRRIDVLHPSRSYPSPALENRPSLSDLRECGIDCKVNQSSSVYVAASGLAFPCCFLGSQYYERPGAPDSRFERPGMRGQLTSYFRIIDLIGADNLDLEKNPLPVVVNRYFPQFAYGWAEGENRIVRCAQTCGTTGVDPITTTYMADYQLY